jgi:hypothetical protein
MKNWNSRLLTACALQTANTTQQAAAEKAQGGAASGSAEWKWDPKGHSSDEAREGAFHSASDHSNVRIVGNETDGKHGNYVSTCC